MKRIWSLVAVLALAVGLLFAGSAPEKAEAAVTWPLQIPSAAYGLNVASDGNDILFTDCGNSYISGRITDDAVRYDYTPAGSTLSCQDTTNTELVARDGTVYLKRWDSSASVSQLVAVKNGRIKWSTNLSWTGSCPGNAWPWNSYNPESLSVGADGNVYFVAMPTSGNCPAYLVGVNAYTGQQLSITQDIGPWAWVGQIRPKVWTYSDHIIFIDAWNTKRVYGYDGVEDATKQYQFNFNSNLYGTAYANKDGRVFAVIACGGGLIMYSDLNGDAGSISRGDCGGVNNLFTVGPNGTIVSYHPLNGGIWFYDPAISSSSIRYLSTIAGGLGYLNMYSDGITDLKVDEDGNVLATMTYTTSTSGAIKDTYVEYIDATTNVSSALLSLYGDGTDANRPSTAGQTGLVNKGYLYSPILKGYDSSGYFSYIHKTDVATAGFGTAVPQGPGFAEPTDKLEYVAMGDSFSSGEGVTPFIAGTDKDAPGENRCHRSEDAYPLLLEEDSDLNLNLTAFVACSGATTDTVLNGSGGIGSWAEGSQLDALSPSTDIVTITIGGNDVGFGPFMEACFELGDSCNSTSAVFAATGDALLNDFPSDLSSLLQAIQSKIGSGSPAKILIIGYPAIISNSSLGLGSPWSCLATLTTGDLATLQGLAGDINSVIQNALISLDDERFHFVDPMAGNAIFGDHDMCSDDWYIYPYDLGRPYVFVAHPTSSGQETYAMIIKQYLEDMD